MTISLYAACAQPVLTAHSCGHTAMEDVRCSPHESITWSVILHISTYVHIPTASYKISRTRIIHCVIMVYTWLTPSEMRRHVRHNGQTCEPLPPLCSPTHNSNSWNGVNYRLNCGHTTYVVSQSDLRSLYCICTYIAIVCMRLSMSQFTPHPHTSPWVL